MGAMPHNNVPHNKMWVCERAPRATIRLRGQEQRKISGYKEVSYACPRRRTVARGARSQTHILMWGMAHMALALFRVLLRCVL